MLDCSAAVCSLYQQHHRTLAKSLVHTNRLGQVLTGLTCTSHPVDLCCMREKSSRDAQGAMGTRRLCLIAWTVATGIVTGAVPGSDSQCIADSRPAHLIAEPNRTSSFTVQSLANNASCEWLISSNTISTRLRLTAAIFNLRSYNGSCVDNFTVFDGNSSSSPILLSTCSTIDFPIYSSGSDVLVSFTTGSDDSWETSDFVINYEVFGFSTCASDVLLRAVYRNPQYLEYPENNQNYTNNADYGWLVQTSRDDYVVHVTFMFVSTESGRDCSYDYIDVYDGTSALSRKLVRLCGMLAMQREVYSSGQSLLIRFHSDSTETGQGFRLLYTAVSRSEGPQDSDKMCSHHREVNTTTHLLIYSTSFTDSANCSWLLQTSINDYVVHVTFTYVNMQTTDNCSHDYVELFDLSKLCPQPGQGVPVYVT
ncbi:deleted in malignant brain tumors 1 protein-like isoform X1 [Pomacea canaliculata]|uniref:deleted in malignant brain tumors 1 protein-like isoform X1 n=1 Tax=Pomacea canaliculata TaxID=400727 RepID=UPI000D73DE55|nr:deleted in malignant brain tumors 1 protein-like isoform X1 [Pomacea canaliculata]